MSGGQAPARRAAQRQVLPAPHPGLKGVRAGYTPRGWEPRALRSPGWAVGGGGGRGVEVGLEEREPPQGPRNIWKERRMKGLSPACAPPPASFDNALSSLWGSASAGPSGSSRAERGGSAEHGGRLAEGGGCRAPEGASLPSGFGNSGSPSRLSAQLRKLLASVPGPALPRSGRRLPASSAGPGAPRHSIWPAGAFGAPGPRKPPPAAAAPGKDWNTRVCGPSYDRSCAGGISSRGSRAWGPGGSSPAGIPAAARGRRTPGLSSQRRPRRAPRALTPRGRRRPQCSAWGAAAAWG